MVRISTPALNASEAMRSQVSAESLGEDDERFYGFIKAELNKSFRQPEEDTIRFILNYSKFLQERRK